MGCFVSTANIFEAKRRSPRNIGEIAVFVPGFRIPKPLHFMPSLDDEGLPTNLLERLFLLRARVVALAAQEASMIYDEPRRAATQLGDSTLADLLQTLEDYLPVLLALVNNGNQLKQNLQFSWVNQEDKVMETTMSDSWYEILSVLHLIAMLTLMQANLLLLPNKSISIHWSNVSNDFKCASVDILLKAAGYLDFAVQHILPGLPSETRNNLPLDLTEGVLKALCLQALGQCIEVQLGIALDSTVATVAVKRRLACEMVKYWFEAQRNMQELPPRSTWGEKHKLFIQWKLIEAKVVAYHLHGLMLLEGKKDGTSNMAVSAMQASEELYGESERARKLFHKTQPLSCDPHFCGINNYLLERLAQTISSKAGNGNNEIILQAAPALPDFVLSLKPDEYHLPPSTGSYGIN